MAERKNTKRGRKAVTPNMRTIYTKRQRARKRGLDPDTVAPLPGKQKRSGRRPTRPRDTAASLRPSSPDLLEIVLQIRKLLTGLTPEQRTAIRTLL